MVYGMIPHCVTWRITAHWHGSIVLLATYTLAVCCLLMQIPGLPGSNSIAALGRCYDIWGILLFLIALWRHGSCYFLISQIRENKNCCIGI